MSDDGIRAFVAVELPDAVRAAIGDATGRLRQRLPRARWVRPEALHLTVKFLGDVDEACLATFGDRSQATVRGRGPALIHLAGAGFFPGARRPRVAWMGGEAPHLEPIATAVDELAVPCGVERDRRRWSPHLTLARLRDPWSDADVERFSEAIGALGPYEFECRELVVFSSRLDPGGAVHTPLRRLSLT